LGCTVTANTVDKIRLVLKKGEAASNYLLEGGFASNNSMTERNHMTTQTRQASDEVELKANKPGSTSSRSSHAHQVPTPEVPLQVEMALETLRHTPEVRYELVERIRAEIEAGTYRIDNMLIARKLLGIPQLENIEAIMPEGGTWSE
jgi:flagellar biosynthesis anti-sigma factor FlgM